MKFPFKIVRTDSTKEKLESRLEAIERRLTTVEQASHIWRPTRSPFHAGNHHPVAGVVERILNHLRLEILPIPRQESTIILKSTAKK